MNDAEVAPDVYTVDEVAQKLRIGRNTVYELVARGDIPHIRFGNTIRIPADELDEWLRASADDRTRFAL